MSVKRRTPDQHPSEGEIDRIVTAQAEDSSAWEDPVRVEREGARAFSMANKPSGNSKVELHVRRVPEGAGTGYIHEQLQVGESLKLS